MKAPAGKVFFRKTVSLKNFDKAYVSIVCDNRFVLFINGKKVAQDNDWNSAEFVNVSKYLKNGNNAVAVDATNDDIGAAAFLARFVIYRKDRTTTEVLTDSSWKVSLQIKQRWKIVKFDDSRWKAAKELGPYGMGPWKLQPTGGKPTKELVLPGPQKVTVVKNLKLLPGFQAELIYTVPKAAQGSWVSMTTDPKGRLIVSDQYGSLYRVIPGKGNVLTTFEKLKTPLGMAHGMLFAFHSLYVVGKGPQGTGLYRLQDLDGDDQFEKVTLLRKLRVGSEHHAHAVILGPDHKLYIVAGNFSVLPKGVEKNSPRRNYKNDWLLPQHLPASGHNKNGIPLAGFILRTDSKGKKWELICGGFRNPYDIAFNDQGELFAYDSDMEYDSGTAWYRPTRLNHVISGAEFGWRRGAAKWPAYYADSFGSVVDIGQGSPTGVTFGYGAKFPAKYQQALFLNDWTYGRIRAVHLEPSGATYKATYENFVIGRPLPLTDSVIGKDGALYFLVGGRRTQSKLFRITYTGEKSTAPYTKTENRLAARSRKIRHKLEYYHTKQDRNALVYIWPYLNSPDRSIRFAARLAVENQPVQWWRGKAVSENQPQAAIMALIALARAEDKQSQQTAFDAFMRIPLKRLPREQVAEALRAIALVFIRLGKPTDEQKSQLTAKLDPLFPYDDMAVDHELARLLVYLDVKAVVAKAMKLVEKSRIQEDEMFYINLLRLMKKGWTKKDRIAYFNWINKARFRLNGGSPFDAGGYFRYSGGISFRPYVEIIRKEMLENIGEDEKKDAALLAVINAKEPPPRKSSYVLELQRQPYNWQMSELVPLLGKVKKGRNFKIGKAAYEAVTCARCHKFGNFVGDVNLGPDLTTAGSRYSAKDLLENIIEPSKVISDQHAARFVVTDRGLTYHGTIVKETDKVVVIKPDPSKPATVTISKDEIDERGISKVSRMPTGLLNSLTREQILDLMAYVLSGGKQNDPSFRKTSTQPSGKPSSNNRGQSKRH